jgi:hypothetical protein
MEFEASVTGLDCFEIASHANLAQIPLGKTAEKQDNDDHHG